MNACKFANCHTDFIANSLLLRNMYTAFASVENRIWIDLASCRVFDFLSGRFSSRIYIISGAWIDLCGCKLLLFSCFEPTCSIIVISSNWRVFNIIYLSMYFCCLWASFILIWLFNINCTGQSLNRMRLTVKVSRILFHMCRKSGNLIYYISKCMNIHMYMDFNFFTRRVSFEFDNDLFTQVCSIISFDK